MRNGQHIRNGVTGFGDACEDDAARTILYAVLAPGPRFIPPEIGVPNDLARLWMRMRYPLVVRSFRGCSGQPPLGSPRYPGRQVPRQ